MPERKNTNNSKPATPKFVNRGPAGLLSKLPSGYKSNLTEKKEETGLNIKVDTEKAPKNRIAESLQSLVVDIDTLTLDPENARLHPERNLQAIMDSLAKYGQMVPIVVRREGMVVVAGNGRVQAAKNLGWTKIAATIEDMEHIDAIGYGLADNRTAELASWHEKTLCKLEKLMAEKKHPSIGWTSDELEVFLATNWDWIKPPTDESEFGTNGDSENEDDSSRTIKFTETQWEAISQVIDKIAKDQTIDIEEVDIPQFLTQLCVEWYESVYNQESNVNA